MGKSEKSSAVQSSHSGVIPYRIRDGVPEVLVVTSSGSGNWVIPKGHIIDEVGPRESARREAFEEAGVEGEVGLELFGRYRHGNDESLVDVFTMLVTAEAAAWPEQEVRQRRWILFSDVDTFVDEPGLRTLLRKAGVGHGLTPARGAASRFSGRGAALAVGTASVLIAMVAFGANARGNDPEPPDAEAVRSSPAVPSAAPLAVDNDVCRITDEPAQLPDDLPEASGAAASLAHPGIIWTHNDGGPAYLYAVDRAGNSKGRVRVTGADVVDWESIDVGPCAAGQCVYVGDIGDNDAERSGIIVYRVPEPSATAAATAPAEALRARFPDGPADAEALFVTPQGVIYVVTKGDRGPVTVYRFPDSSPGGNGVTLERVRVLGDGRPGKNEQITGADMSPDGNWIVLRTNRKLQFYSARGFDGSSAPAKEMDLRPLKEPQGEGVSFGANSGKILITSEGGKKKKPGSVAELDCVLDS